MSLMMLLSPGVTGTRALRDASFTVPSGSIAALVGVNGSGKSTLFKAIMGFVRLTSGKISVLGIPTRQALQKNLVAYVPQSEDVDWSFPVLVEDVVMMGRYGHMGMLRIAKKRDRQIVTDALERVDMVNFRHRQIGELSGGQKKRVFLARAIAQQGDVILLDEPFTGVDVKTEAKIISLQSFLEGVTRGRQNDACLNTQSRIRHDILRLYGHGQRHRPGKRADRHHFYSREPRAGF
ncbi:hypothetical protein EIMP300_59590 [Escherichia coli]|uniref:ABC transporter domain-containing protein n=1 Tax=Escherichia coli TaxID=562 RepID=A0A8S0FXD1_ECOLX|nr:hypothetical protein EIMP300_59590 [Escherichia coli]